MKEEGFDSKTVMLNYYSSINSKDYFDVVLTTKPTLYSKVFSPISAYYWYVKYLLSFDIFHLPCSGFFLGSSILWRLEGPLFRLFGKKIIVIPYGGDFYMYSKIKSPSLQHGLLLSYPKNALNEGAIARKVKYWTRQANIFITCFQLGGASRWDVLPFNALIINTKEWTSKKHYNKKDGKNGFVNIAHTPNHRGFKGTEFLIQAVKELQDEGLLINLILIEKKPNSEVKKILFEDADILAEQFIATAYALSGVEGMATGLPVMSNLDEEIYTRLFRRFSYLNECPILSTTPENIKENLKILITNPELRKELGIAGQRYVAKYHSYSTSKYFFGAIYKNIWNGEKLDLLNMFHPLKKSSYNNKMDIIKHPLIENKLPSYV
ncbi:MAG: glycosyltransferase [Saprospiraceae bacterium]